MRPIVIPERVIRWALVAVVIVALALATLALWRLQGVVGSVCHAAKDNRAAAIADVTEQAQILVETAARNAEREGDAARADRLRTQVGRAFVAEQRAKAIARRPPIDCSKL